MNELPRAGFLRLPQIIGNPKKGIAPLIPVSRSSWWRGVRDGRYPKAVKLGPRTTAWPVESIHALIASTSTGEAA
jgi:predicted DNA-binding transcriptional regulator AlpA